jgi:hypothetical protein
LPEEEQYAWDGLLIVMAASDGPNHWCELSKTVVLRAKQMLATSASRLGVNGIEQRMKQRSAHRLISRPKRLFREVPI